MPPKLSDISVNSRGFSLIEVILAMTFLTTIIIGSTEMMRGSFDLKTALSQKGKVLHRINLAMNRVSTDLQHAFIISTNDQEKNGIGRRTKSIFSIKRGSSGTRLALTTRTNIPMTAGSHETDATYVIYELMDSKKAAGRKNLVRKDARMIPEDMRDDPPPIVIARNIKSFTVEWWRGDKWEQSTFDSNERDTRNKLPRLVKVTIEAWSEDREDGDGTPESVDEYTDQISTVVFLPMAVEYKEIAEQFKTIKWDF